MGKLVGKLWLPEYQQELSGGRLAVVFPAVGSQAIGVFSRDIFVAQMDIFSSTAWLIWVLHETPLGSLLVFALAAIVVVEKSAG